MVDLRTGSQSKNNLVSRIASRALHCTLCKTLSVPKERTRARSLSFILNFSLHRRTKALTPYSRAGSAFFGLPKKLQRGPPLGSEGVRIC